MDRRTAEEIAGRIENVFAAMDPLVSFLRERLEPDDLDAVREAFSRIIAELDLGVLEVIYRAHPDLRPEGMVPVTPLGSGCPFPPRAETEET